MKHTLLIITFFILGCIAACMLPGCTQTVVLTPEEAKAIEEEKTQERTNYIKKHIEVVELEGHEFIIFDTNSGKFTRSGICHHPDCKFCKDKQ